jgi:hypothetical protein
MGKRFELRTYHSGLKYLFEQLNLNSRKTRWIEFLSEYDFDIKHIKGKENKVVDALSRRVHLMHVYNCQYASVGLEEKNFRCCCYRSTLPIGKENLTTRIYIIENEII